MEEIDEFSSEEENEDSDESELDETNDEPVIIRSHKHNLRKKKKKVNYSESSKKSQTTLEDLQKETDEETDESDEKTDESEEETEESDEESKKKSRKRSRKKVKKVTEKNKKKSANSKQIIKRVLIEIVQSLSFYWKEPSKNTLISTILDPRYKDLNFLSVKSKLETETYLQQLYDDLNFQLNPDSYLSEISITKQPSNEDSIFGALFGSDKRHKKKANEVESYLNESITEKAEFNSNTYEWWNDHKKIFPVLSILARKFLSVPATSVPSERLFSDAGNNMTNRRTSLSSKIFQELIFVKRNSKYIDIFTLLANKVNIFISIIFESIIKYQKLTFFHKI